MTKTFRKPVICHCKKFRKELGLLSKAVAYRTDITRRWLTQIENGRNVNIETALRIASVLGKRVEELWELKQEQTQHS